MVCSRRNKIEEGKDGLENNRSWGVITEEIIYLSYIPIQLKYLQKDVFLVIKFMHDLSL